MKRTAGRQTPKNPNARRSGQTPARTLRTPQRARTKEPIAPRPGSDEARKAETAEARAKFLDTFAHVGNVRAASKISGVGRRTHYDWLETDEAYAQAFEDARAEAADRLEQEARRRALVGVDEPVYGRLPGANAGIGIVGYVRRFSDNLLMFLLKNWRPEVYTNRHELTGKDGAPLAARPAVTLYMPNNGRARRSNQAPAGLAKLTLDELAALEQLVLKATPDADGEARLRGR